jgi:hypothetical protein
MPKKPPLALPLLGIADFLGNLCSFGAYTKAVVREGAGGGAEDQHSATEHQQV